VKNEDVIPLSSRQNDLIVSQEKDCGRRKSFLDALKVLLKKLGALKQFHFMPLLAIRYP
jgi:hypothetical protein